MIDARRLSSKRGGSAARRSRRRTSTPSADERAHDDAYAWIKALRHCRVDGEPFRRRFTLRGDSLWWFAELYLHKEQVILSHPSRARGARRARSSASGRWPDRGS